MKHLTRQTMEVLGAGEPAWLCAWREVAFAEWERVDSRPSPKVRRFPVDATLLDVVNPKKVTRHTTSLHAFEFKTDVIGMDEMALLNRAFCNRAHVVRIEEGKTIRVQSKLDGGPLFEYLVVVADEGVTGGVTITTEGGSAGAVHFQTVHVIAAPNAIATVTLLEDSPAALFVTRTAEVDRNARVEWVESVFGSNTTRVTSETRLVASGATTSRTSMYVGNASSFDVKEDVLHDAPHTTSAMVSKAALGGTAKVAQQGTIRMTKMASQAVGSERMDTLMLSDEAQANPVPVLEIEREDVQVSHASTTGRLDPGHVFYLQSRGLTKEQARKALARASLQTVLDRIQDPSAEAWIQERLETAAI